MGVIIRSRGNFEKTRRFFGNVKQRKHLRALHAYGNRGVSALASATPVRSGKTAQSWGYRVIANRGQYRVEWTNSHVNQGVTIAILIQYGHATRTGGIVQGRDFINPAIRPVFDRLADEAWREVTQS